VDAVWFVLGLLALLLGAGLLVRGAARLAVSVGVSPLVVGLTIVAFGTSAPELAVSLGSAVRGSQDVAIGNVVGSNICNVLLILGLAALITPLSVTAQIVRQEVPVMIGASALLVWLAADGTLSPAEGGALVALLLVYTTFLILQSRRQTKAAASEYAHELAFRSRWDRHWAVQLAFVAAGLSLLMIGSDWFVSAAVAFARTLGVGELVIGLTIVAIGTSMPELATSVVAACRGERDIAIGNVVGSNVFNLLGCAGASSLASAGGLAIDAELVEFDLWVLLAVAVACWPVFLTGRRIARWEGAFFLFYFAAYTAYVIMKARADEALPSFRWTMLTFVVPLTGVTLFVSLWRAGAARVARP
jgi:cation:H+ antiporter